jgi:hypothetical protein
MTKNVRISALTMCLVLVADAWQRAVLQGRPMVGAGVWVGPGFQAKGEPEDVLR